MKPFRLDRRTLLRGAGGIAIGLPFLEIMSRSGSAGAQAAPVPKRLVVFFSPNGSIRENWTPTGGETNFTLSRILAPLEPFKQNLVVLDGVDNVCARNGLGDDHMRGMGAMLTGVELLPGTTQGGSGDPAGLAGGISVDQKIANVIGKSTKFKSMELGVIAGNGGDVWSYTSYSDANVPLPPDNNPASVFKRIFAEVGTDATAAQKLRAERKTVLDAAMDGYGKLAPKLGASDKARMDAHFTEIRELEARLAATVSVGDACVKPAAPTIDYKANDNFPAIGKAQMDLLVMGLACDLSRVATIQWERSVGDVRFTWLGITRGHHAISHDPDSQADSVEMLTKINVWYSEQFAYLLGKLASIKEGAGTMLDNTLVFWCNELSRGNAHSHPDMPFVLAGGAGGALKTGRFLVYPKTANVPHNNLLVSLMNAFGLPDKTFGNPAYCTGPLSGLV
jgi:Protein of unknown function (DUF1552)